MLDIPSQNRGGDEEEDSSADWPVLYIKEKLDQVLELGEEQVVIFLTLSIPMRTIIIAAMPHE